MTNQQNHSSPRQIILGAHFPGVNHHTVWSDPESGSHIEFESFEKFAAEAERGRLDFIFLAEGLRLRENRGLIHDLDVVGRPDTLPILAALASVTDHIGLVGTINATFNEPYEVARQFSTLDYVSNGRAGWNIVTTSDSFHGANFRRGGYLDRADRYVRASQALDVANRFWASWKDVESERERVNVTNDQFDIHGEFPLPRSPQGRPLIFQAGKSAQGQDFAAGNADAIFTLHTDNEDSRQFYHELSERVRQAGRDPESVKILPGTSVVVADTDEEAEELAATIRAQQVSGQTAILLLEQIWNRELSEFDPEGPLPDVDPVVGETTISKGRSEVRHDDRFAAVQKLRDIAEARNLNLRETVIATQSRQTFVGSPETVASEMIETVETHVSDGFILAPHLSPTGLVPFIDRVVPLLQERGALRTEYPEGATLRELLGLPTTLDPATTGRATFRQGVNVS
ncbi:NtaA/DmoA family FMN-dependent monooxygenase [Auritidibacter sp. NML100628]|uniref:NtaA/DmoA family FMN-dependent monooxygenase n=1 Tax=Auritidibacter sp. NML100628 TaxID=2170742 RepID=UPI000D73481F|nr:NtaA/DmoA family FMN-dependent monooxygenase [Auritidibacter sp. NML100628]PXA75798.1 F420-dependent methylene-tetrahydromethanopterin reductase [Auritidibacter sp. NML100628]